MTDGPERNQKHEGRDGSYDHEHDIDGAVQDLPGMAVDTLRQMLLVVAAHLRRQAGNVVAPAGQDVADHFICANVAHQPRPNSALPYPGCRYPIFSLQAEWLQR